MKTKSGKSSPKLKSKAHSAKNISGKAKTVKKPAAKAHSSKARKGVGSVKKAPISIAAGGNGTLYDRQVFVRFETPALKEMVRKAAMASDVSLSAYIAAAAVDWAENGRKLKAEKKELAAAEATGT